MRPISSASRPCTLSATPGHATNTWRSDRALISVAIAASLGTLEPLRGQIRIALNNGVTKEEIVEAFIQVEAYAGAARAFDGYQITAQVFAESANLS